jgi:hypothetical protein
MDRDHLITADQNRKDPLFILFGKADLCGAPIRNCSDPGKQDDHAGCPRIDRSISLSQAGEPGIKFSTSTHTLMPRPRNSATILRCRLASSRL